MRGLFLSLVYLLSAVFVLLFVSVFFALPPSALVKSLGDAETLFALKFTFLTALAAAAVSMLLAIPAAYALARYEFYLKRFLKLVLDLPIAFPEILTGLLLLLLFSKLSSFWELFKIAFSPAAVVVAQIFVSLPFALKVLHTAFERIDPRYELVARTLGYGAVETFLKVTLPMARRALFAAAAVAFARAFGAFGAVLIFAGGVRMKTETLPVGIFLNLSVGELERAVAMGAILIVASLLALGALELLTPGGEKGV